MTADQVIGFIAALVVMLAGLAGAILPGVPGTPLVFVAALGHWIWFRDQSISIWILAVIGFLAAFSVALDFTATALGTRQLGGTWRGMLGAAAGALIGIFAGPIGIILGPIVGATIGEMLGGREWREACKAGVGAAIGFLAGTVGRIACCFAMIGLFTLNLLLKWVR